MKNDAVISAKGLNNNYHIDRLLYAKVEFQENA